MRFLRLPSFSFAALLVLTLVLFASSPASWAANAAGKPVTKATTAPKVDSLKRPLPLELMIDKSVPVTFERPAATVFIANPDIADVQVLTPNSVMVYGKKAGQTTLIITDTAGKDLAYRTVMVSQNLADLREALKTVAPGSNIQVESIPNGIVLTGSAVDASAIEDARRLAARYLPEQGADIINRVKVNANNQVQIRVRFAEVAKDVDKRFGINWESIGNVGLFTFGLATGADFLNPDTPALYDRTSVGDSVNNAINGSFNNKHFSVNGMIDALAKDGFVTILAEPSLTAMSGETASFLAGGEFPIPVPQSADTITIEWKQYGVSLAFTPTIINDNRINLHVRPEVSQLSEAGSVTLNDINIPALTTRRAETTIELNSGQSFAIAGLLNNQQTQSVDKFPFLGDMPVLGPLFRSSRFQNNETELVIIITPYLVKPTTQERLALPTDGYSPPSDQDRLWLMRKTNSDPNARPVSGPARTVTVPNPLDEEEAPSPASAPVAPVTNSAPASTSAARPLPMTPIKAAPVAPAKTTTKIKTPGPSGQGGFIVE